MNRYRPTGVTVIAILCFIYGVLGVLGALAILGIPLPDPLGRFTLALGLVALLIAVVYLVVGYGLWALREWGRIAAIVVGALWLLGNLASGVAMLFGLDTPFGRVSFPGAGAGALVQAAIAGFIVYYLSRSDVREAFGSGAAAPAWVSNPAPPTIPAQTNFVVVDPPQIPVQAAPSRPTELVAAPLPAIAWLVPRGPSRSSRQYPIQSHRAVIGRDDSHVDINLDDPTISNEHAAIVFENNRFIVQDLASRNGTYVNGQRIQRQMLYDGDEIRLGNSVLVFKKV